MDLMTNMNVAELREWLIAAVGTVGLIWYYLCVIDMGLRPTPKTEQSTGFRQFQSLSVTTISVSLATYVGYVVGVPVNSMVTQVPPSAAAATPGGGSVSGNLLPAISAQAQISELQWLAAAAYVASLVLAVWLYYRKKDETEPAIAGLAKSLLGFVAGVFALTLSVPSSP